VKTANSAMIALLNSAGPANPLMKANLFTFTLANGSILNITDFDKDVSDASSVIYSSRGPLPRVSEFSWRVGVQVEQLKLELWSLLTDLVGSAVVLESIANQQWANALVQVQRAYWAQGSIAASQKVVPVGAPGTIKIFQGNVSDVTAVDGVHAELNIKSRKELLSIQWPYNTFQPACRWPLYGPGCTVNQSSFQKTGTVSSGSIALLLNTSLTDPDNYYSEGTIVFTSGANAGVKRTIRSYLNASGQILLFIPLPNAPSSGDAFTVAPGCDHTMSTCQNTFSNLINFGGAPFIPVPESSV
jgi:uncharacterized phage protein (TIGR02218 family)